MYLKFVYLTASPDSELFQEFIPQYYHVNKPDGESGAPEMDIDTPQFVTPQYNPVIYDRSAPVYIPNLGSASLSFSLDETTLKDYVKKQM